MNMNFWVQLRPNGVFHLVTQIGGSVNNREVSLRCNVAEAITGTPGASLPYIDFINGYAKPDVRLCRNCSRAVVEHIRLKIRTADRLGINLPADLLPKEYR